jgi:hypothetical protein
MDKTHPSCRSRLLLENWISVRPRRPEVPANVIPVELVAGIGLTGPDRELWFKSLADSDAPSRPILDRLGHHRVPYQGMLIYCWACYAAAEEARALRQWSTRLQQQILLPALDEPLFAEIGNQVADAAWSVLAQWACARATGDSALQKQMHQWLGQLHLQQDINGAFLREQASEHPETHWYHELVILHALSSLALHTRDEQLMNSILRSARYHLHHTQPDHATRHPFAVHAFLLADETKILADQMMHACRMQPDSAVPLDPVSFALLADALYCLRPF